ncbi:MAG: hypothetical protein ACLTDR_01165 [Adlercreutzia equolifaciens]
MFGELVTAHSALAGVARGGVAAAFCGRPVLVREPLAQRMRCLTSAEKRPAERRLVAGVLALSCGALALGAGCLAADPGASTACCRCVSDAARQRSRTWALWAVALADGATAA